MLAVGARLLRRSPSRRADPSRSPTQVTNTGAALSGGDAETVQPFDTLDINVLQLESLNRTVEVNSVGVISLPLAGDFNVVGKTTKQIAADIADRLGPSRSPKSRGHRNPQGSVATECVSLRDTARRGFTVEGSVDPAWRLCDLWSDQSLLQGHRHG